MPRWKNPSEALPSDFYCGDRIIGVVRERNPKTLKFERRLVILEATETGWKSPDETYGGYSIHDCEFWATEKNMLQFAEQYGVNGI